MPASVLDARITAVNKTDQNLCSPAIHILFTNYVAFWMNSSFGSLKLWRQVVSL